MSTDPIQALIDAGAIPSHPFGPNSRYRAVPLGLYQPRADEPPVAYVLRRFIPPASELPARAEHIVRAGERPDLIAAAVFGDPELYWRIADANAVTDPFELTDAVLRRVAIPAAPGV